MGRQTSSDRSRRVLASPAHPIERHSRRSHLLEPPEESAIDRNPALSPSQRLARGLARSTPTIDSSEVHPGLRSRRREDRPPSQSPSLPAHVRGLSLSRGQALRRGRLRDDRRHARNDAKVRDTAVLGPSEPAGCCELLRPLPIPSDSETTAEFLYLGLIHSTHPMDFPARDFGNSRL